MEQEHMPYPSQGPGQCGVDREVFERVWRRVMPEDRCDCPFQLYGEEERDQMDRLLERGEAAESLPALPQGGEREMLLPALGGRSEKVDNDVPCLGAASAVYGEQLQEFISDELSDARTYLSLAKRAPAAAARVLSSMAAEERRHAKRLSAAYFLISGVRFWPDRMPSLPIGATFLGALRTQFAEEQKGASAYLAAAEESSDPCLRELYRELASDEAAHAWLIRGILEQL